ASPPAKSSKKRKTRNEDQASVGAGSTDTSAAVVVFTGTLVEQSRKQVTAEAEAKGFRVQPRMTKMTTFLVCGDRAGQKLQEAKKLGVVVLSEAEWKQWLAGLASPGAPDSSSKRSKKRSVDLESKSPDSAKSDSEIEYDEETGALNGVAPKELLVDGTFRDVKSASGSTYLVKRLGMVYTCNCPAWRNQRHPPNSRTCKHLKLLLGEEFEAIRAKGSAATSGGAGKSGSARSVVKTTAPKVLLAKKWDREKNDPVKWWISEKLDGVRAFWDSSKRIFLSRLGNEYPAPSWFTDGFPDDVDLDGELFGGRGAFQFTVGVAKTQGATKQWEKLVYKVFDAPSLAQQKFEERMAHAKELVAKTSSKYIEWVEHTQCRSLSHLDEVFADIEKLGGEGLMIREPGSKYAAGRSSSLLKIKSFHDGEAEVLAHEDGKGKYVGMVGALRCRMASGKMFKVASGLSDEQRDSPPAIGSIIVYKCQELTNDGIPRFPVFLGIAADKTCAKDPVIANAVGRD
ncbi:hypothetical protein BBJ28_00024101, partial [Nothophytophthora sp. Chile5]